METKTTYMYVLQQIHLLQHLIHQSQLIHIICSQY